jgi:hypothetical protein
LPIALIVGEHRAGVKKKTVKLAPFSQTITVAVGIDWSRQAACSCLELSIWLIGTAMTEL